MCMSHNEVGVELTTVLSASFQAGRAATQRPLVSSQAYRLQLSVVPRCA